MARLPLQLPKFAREPVFGFISKRSGPFDGAVTLTRDRVYIVPTRAGIIFSLLLLILLIGSVNYEKNLGFVLTFLLVGIGNVALLSTWRNLAGLRLKSLPGSPVFTGDMATFAVQLINHRLLDRHSLIISHSGIDYDVVDCVANSHQLMQFKVKTVKRGRLNAGRFRLYTEFPTGLFVAWTWVDLSMTCLTYPNPDAQPLLRSVDLREDGDNDFSGKGMENFNQLKKYNPGDNINRISWKASAKNEMLFMKEFVGAITVPHWIDWDAIPAKNTEHRLSIMSALIIKADGQHQHYGLKLPGKIIQPDFGDRHYHRCLSALALY